MYKYIMRTCCIIEVLINFSIADYYSVFFPLLPRMCLGISRYVTPFACEGLQCQFLGTFSQLCEEATISFIISFRPSVRMEQLCFHLTDFHEIWYLRIFFFWKSFEKIQVSLKSDKNVRYFTWRPIYIFVSCLAHISS